MLLGFEPITTTRAIGGPVEDPIGIARVVWSGSHQWKEVPQIFNRASNEGLLKLPIAGKCVESRSNDWELSVLPKPVTDWIPEQVTT